MSKINDTQMQICAEAVTFNKDIACNVYKLIVSLFSNHSAVKRELIILTLDIMKRRQEPGIGISFIDS